MDYDLKVQRATIVDGTGAPDAVGIEAVIVNGTVVRRSGRDVVDPAGPLPGQLLRSRAGA